MGLSKVYNALLVRIINKTFPIWQQLGFHITLNHFYQPIPDTRTLRNDLWQRRSELIGIDINENRQIELLSSFSTKFKKEYEAFEKNRTLVSHQYYIENGAFGSVDGEMLYCIIRNFKPNRMIEIGSGFSTFLSAFAIQKNKESDNNYECELISIEPYPNEILKSGFPGLSKLIAQKAQDVPFSEFEKLKENDILFIDSSHVLKIGSDVQYEFLEILPRLNKGVIVHFHDIFMPAEYSKDWIFKKNRFWNEQYLLQAFLAFNSHFEVLWAGSFMHLTYPDRLEKAFDSYKRNNTCPGSFWIRKTI